MTDHVHDDCVQCLQREVRDLKKKLDDAQTLIANCIVNDESANQVEGSSVAEPGQRALGGVK